jgi:hypothetical protein
MIDEHLDGLWFEHITLKNRADVLRREMIKSALEVSDWADKCSDPVIRERMIRVRDNLKFEGSK